MDSVDSAHSPRLLDLMDSVGSAHSPSLLAPSVFTVLPPSLNNASSLSLFICTPAFQVFVVLSVGKNQLLPKLMFAFFCCCTQAAKGVRRNIYDRWLVSLLSLWPKKVFPWIVHFLILTIFSYLCSAQRTYLDFFNFSWWIFYFIDTIKITRPSCFFLLILLPLPLLCASAVTSEEDLGGCLWVIIFIRLTEVGRSTHCGRNHFLGSDPSLYPREKMHKGPLPSSSSLQTPCAWLPWLLHHTDCARELAKILLSPELLSPKCFSTAARELTKTMLNNDLWPPSSLIPTLIIGRHPHRGFPSVLLLESDQWKSVRTLRGRGDRLGLYSSTLPSGHDFSMNGLHLNSQFLSVDPLPFLWTPLFW